MNWYWNYYPIGDREYKLHGIPYVYGNFSGFICDNWAGRVAAGMKGFAVSSWGASDFKQMQRGQRLANAVYSARMAWSTEYNEKDKESEICDCASSVFDYRFREAMKGSYVDILHTANFTITHGYFGCGDLLDDNMFRLGYYHVYYKDGTDERVELLWGENIGPDIIHDSEKVNGYLDGEVANDVLDCQETIFTCDFEIMNGKRYYRFVIPTDKEIARVEPELFDEYRDGVFISRIDIHNA